MIELAALVDIIHFVEAGAIDEHAEVDIALIEGSVTTADEQQRIQSIRHRSKYLISIGACATSGGIQALRNINDSEAWVKAIYPKREWVEALTTATPMKAHVRIDYELWGCPISTQQIMRVLHNLIQGIEPIDEQDSVCLACKRDGNACLVVTKGEPCMGPVTRTGCNAICPKFGRACYACYGPKENANAPALVKVFQSQGLSDKQIQQRFQFINNAAPEFQAHDTTHNDGDKP